MIDQDKFRIRIWGADGVIYDNEVGVAEDADPGTVLESGNILIRTTQRKP